jgi:cation transport ATPase
MSNSVASTSRNTDRSKKKTDNRADLIRRLFAVAISVGFASTLVQMDWIKEGRLPNWIEAGQLFALVTALIATVLSWDAYLLAIEERPLTNPLRFAIDMVLIFTYMLLLIVSKHAQFFLPTLAVIFVLYVLWSILTVRDYIVAREEFVSR